MKFLIKILLFVVIAVSAYFLTLVATPYAVLVLLKIKNGTAYNQPVYAEIVTEKERRVVLPNPDFLYIVMGYNLRKGPVKISGKMPEDSYYSVALYEPNTRNFYVKNDRDVPEKKYEFILATQKQQKDLTAGETEIVESPKPVGALLVRILITDPSQIPYLKEIQKSFTIEELK